MKGHILSKWELSYAFLVLISLFCMQSWRNFQDQRHMILYRTFYNGLHLLRNFNFYSSTVKFKFFFTKIGKKTIKIEKTFRAKKIHETQLSEVVWYRPAFRLARSYVLMERVHIFFIILIHNLEYKWKKIWIQNFPFFFHNLLSLPNDLIWLVIHMHVCEFCVFSYLKLFN